MDESSLLNQLRAALAAIETLTRQAEQRERDFAQRERDFAALLDATKQLQDDRDRLADLAEQQRKELKTLREKIAELEAANKELTNQLWGRRSERRVGSDQPLLFPEMEESSDDESDVIVADMDNDAQAEIDEQLIKDWDARRRKARERRRRERSDAFPDHLERRERVLDLDDAEKDGLKYIGDAVSERLRFERPHVYVERIVRRKYVRAGQPDAGVLAPPAPVSLVEGGRYGFDVVAAMLAQKYAFHQPTYRQQDWFAQSGWFPSRSTINDMLNHSVELIGSVFELMRIRLLAQAIIHADETTTLLLTRDSLDEEQLRVIKERRKKKSKPPDQSEDVDLPGSVTSYVWLFAGLDHFAPYNCFHWSITRSHSVVDDWLNGFRGKVVADGYEAYTNLEKRTEGRIVHSSCNVHARREFTKAEIYEPVLCAEATALYRQLYAIEERGKLLDAEGRRKLRQEEAVPVWQTFERWLDSERVQRAALPASRFGKAVGYMRNQWKSLQRYLTDGNLPIDNNQAEQIIRPLTVGRRNWLFLGHPQAAPGRMQLLSVISSAHRHNLMIEDYLADVLEKLALATQREPSLLNLDSEYLAELLPDRWAASHPKSIRTERVQEKTDRAEAKRVSRARRRIAARRKKQADQAN